MQHSMQLWQVLLFGSFYSYCMQGNDVPTKSNFCVNLLAAKAILAETISLNNKATENGNFLLQVSLYGQFYSYCMQRADVPHIMECPVNLLATIAVGL